MAKVNLEAFDLARRTLRMLARWHHSLDPACAAALPQILDAVPRKTTVQRLLLWEIDKLHRDAVARGCRFFSYHHAITACRAAVCGDVRTARLCLRQMTASLTPPDRREPRSRLDVARAVAATPVDMAYDMARSWRRPPTPLPPDFAAMRQHADAADAALTAFDDETERLLDLTDARSQGD